MADQDRTQPQRFGAAAFALSDEQREILEQADSYTPATHCSPCNSAWTMRNGGRLT